MSNIERLLSIAGPALSESTPRLLPEDAALAGAAAPELLRLLWGRNGFVAFESALHVRPLSDEPGMLGIAQWNSPSLWRSSYQGMADGALFFAEDAFGSQFCVVNDEVQLFNPESAEREWLAATLNDWAGLVLGENGPMLTGWPIAHAWQQKNGALPTGNRLVPKVPFILGGDFEPSNLYALDSAQAMRWYGDLAVQLHHLPDGAQVQLRVVE